MLCAMHASYGVTFCFYKAWEMNSAEKYENYEIAEDGS